MKVRCKKIFSLFLSAVFIISALLGYNMLAAAATEGNCGANGNNAQWSYDSSTGTLTISGTGATKNYNAALSQAPWDTYKPNITKIVVEEGITEIGNYNFYNCVALTDVSLPSTLTTLSGSGTMEVSYGCFQNCTSLETISLPENLTTIKNCVFKDCTSLKKITLPDSLTTLSYGAFSNCSALTAVVFGDGLTSTGQNVFYNAGVKNITWGNNMTAIDSYAFFGCGMTSVNIPNEIVSIGTRAFANCTFMTTVTVNNANCSFSGDPFNGSNQTVTICGHKLSTAETYATKYSYQFKSIDDCDHTNTETVVKIEPTCTVKGVSQTVCNDCGFIVSEYETDALGHNMKQIDYLDNTEVDGHIYESTECSRCGYTKDTIEHQRAASGSGFVYKWVDGYYTTSGSATCTESGTVTYTCTVEGCGKREPHVVASLGHTVESWNVTQEPTCTEAGSRTGVCTVCGATVTENIAATGHDYSILIEDVDNTTTDGHIYHVYECSACGEQSTQYEHVKWVEGNYDSTVITNPTCTIDGLRRDTCKVCSTTRNVTLAANGQHEWEETSRTEPTCTVAGRINYQCKNCTRTKYETIEALGHDYVKAESGNQEPTCTESGYYVYKCSRCSASKQETQPALGHTPDETTRQIATEATCEETGLDVVVCAVCGVTYEIVTPALGHNFIENETDLTNENKPGHVLVTPTCIRCKYSDTAYMRHKTWIEGYYTTENGLSPTCSVDGYTKDTCTICGETRRNPVPAIGHLYKYTGRTNSSGAMIYFCSSCALTTTKSPAEVFSAWDIKYVGTAPKRTVSDNTCYLDADKNGIINVKDYAIISKAKKAEAALAEESTSNSESQTETTETQE